MKCSKVTVVTRMAAALVMSCLVSAPVSAQFNVTYLGGNNGDWWTDSNWPLIGGEGKEPLAEFAEHALIDNGSTVVVSRAANPGLDPDEGNPGAVILGPSAGTTGGLRIPNNGELTVVIDTFDNETTSGLVVAGEEGMGTLTVLGGGTLNAFGVTSGGAPSSGVVMGDTSGLTATVSLETASLNRETRVIGPTVNFSASTGYTLGASHVLVSEITSGTTHSPLKSPALVTINGAFRPEFTGITPSVGSRWDIIDAGAIAGGFSSVDTSAAPALGTAQAYRLIRSSGGVNGQRIQLAVDQLLTLEVDRVSGDTSISNEGSVPVAIDGYTIISSLGALTGDWDSLQEQGQTGWQEAAPSASFLNELKTSGSLTVSNGSPSDVGSPYVPVYTQFGADPDHLEFEYTTTAGDIVQGLVKYTGDKVNNTLIVTVDPTSGEAVLKNDSPFSVSIDAYSIFSDSGSLQPGNGDWSSLADQNVTGWEEAAPLSTVISELNPLGDLFLGSEATFDLGEIYDIGGTEDLEFEFFVVGESTPRTGVVVFGVMTVDLPGDANGDGKVDILDLDILSGNFGTMASASAAIPEPSSVGLVILATLAVLPATGLFRTGRLCATAARACVVLLMAALCTTSAQAVVILDEDFEGLAGLPSGWTLVDNDPVGVNNPAYTVVAGHDGSGGSSGSAGHIGDMIDGIPAPGQPAGGWIQLPASATVNASTSWRLSFDIMFGAPAEGGADDAVVVFGDIANRNYYTLVITEVDGNNELFYLANDDRQGVGDGGTPVFGTDAFGAGLVEGAWYSGALTWDATSQGLSFAIGDPSDGSSRGAFNAALNSTQIVFNPGSGQNELINPPLSGNVEFGFGTLNDNGSFDNVLLETITIVPGDVDGNGVADINDFNVIRDNFRQSVVSRAQGDLTGDGFVDFNDFRQWKDNQTPSLSQSVPEPASVGLCLLSAVALVGRRRMGR